uniref:Uncharacterized protein n=1 Tax=Glossina palpalis gambiensis TaxID=67801 RepID=A0A1B0AU40_9MUSC
MNVYVELKEVLGHLCAMLLLLKLRFSYFFDYEPNNSILRSVASLRALALNINIKQESCPATLLEQIDVAFAAYETLENILLYKCSKQYTSVETKRCQMKTLTSPCVVKRLCKQQHISVASSSG